jgi:hypothetical protein
MLEAQNPNREAGTQSRLCDSRNRRLAQAFLTLIFALPDRAILALFETRLFVETRFATDLQPTHFAVRMAAGAGCGTSAALYTAVPEIG